jgi:hypothetical protein
MTLLQIFTNSPLAGITFLICCATILLAIRMVKQLRWKEDRFLVGFLGLLALHQCLTLLRDAGLVPPGWRSAEQVASVLIGGLFLVALVLVRTHLWQLRNAQMRLRISEMNMEPQAWVREEVAAIRERCAAPLRHPSAATTDSAPPTAPIPAQPILPDIRSSPADGDRGKEGVPGTPGLWAFTKGSPEQASGWWSSLGRRLKAAIAQSRLFR